MKQKIDIYEAIADESHDIGYTTICYAIKDMQEKTSVLEVRKIITCQSCFQDISPIIIDTISF